MIKVKPESAKERLGMDKEDLVDMHVVKNGYTHFSNLNWEEKCELVSAHMETHAGYYDCLEALTGAIPENNLVENAILILTNKITPEKLALDLKNQLISYYFEHLDSDVQDYYSDMKFQEQFNDNED